MLTLIRGKNGRAPTLRMRPRDRFFDPIFLYALFLALLFHFLPFLIFKIAPFHLGYDSRILSPATVTAYLEGKEARADLSTEDKEAPIKKLGLLSLPDTPSLSDAHFSLATPFNEELSKGERGAIAPSLPERLHPSLPVYYPDVSIHVSGPLAKKELHLPSSLTSLLSPKEKNPLLVQRKTLTFDVLYEGKSGSLFWFALKSPSRNKKLVEKAEKILSTLSFATDEKSFILPGKVEITLHINQKKSNLSP